MVLPLVDEDKPKCHLCYKRFDDIKQLREHQTRSHADSLDNNEANLKAKPAPGDVTVF